MGGGELLLISGPNGCGKSTLLKVLNGLIQPLCGAVSWKGNCKEYVPQHILPSGHLPLNLGDVLWLSGIKRSVLEPGLRKRAWSRSSGGEQKLALLMTLLHGDRNLLLLDEPLNFLDQKAQIYWLKALTASLKLTSSAVVMVSHHALDTMRVSELRIKRLKLSGSDGAIE